MPNKSESPGEFYLVTAPGLEALALRELTHKYELLRELHGLPFSLRQLVGRHGGISFTADLEIGCALNMILKIPTRILLRQAQFKARDFPDLLRHLKKIPWEKFFRQGEVRVKVASHRSRLKIKSRVEEVTLKALGEAQRMRPWRKPFRPVLHTVLVKIDEDVVTVSIDTSGEALYKRKSDKWVSEAPLRETIASAMVWQMCESQPVDVKRSEEAAMLTVVDPLCGAGTLLLETESLFKINLKRTYAFQDFPSFSGFSFKKLPPEIVPFQLGLRGSDSSEKAIRSATQNFAAISSAQWRLTVMELSEVQASQLAPRLWIMTNPPYNQRIKMDLQELSSNLEKLYHAPEVVGLTYLWPVDQMGFRPLKHQPSQHMLFTSNGGIAVQLVSHVK